VRYLLLLNGTAEANDQWERNTPEENARLRAEEIPKWGAFMGWAQEKGIELNGLELDSRRTAKTVRVRDGNRTVTDGPFAETKEVLGGYFIVDCDNLDEAIDIASRVPVAANGSVEIRPLLES
jgi:hypothetical protein